MADDLTFGWADWLVFCLALLVCVLIGLVQGIRDRWGTRPKNPNAQPGDERDMSLLPVIWSIVATSFSSNFVLGFPAEMYYIGTGFAALCIGLAIGVPTGIIMFVRKLYELRVPSVFEYMGMRYGAAMKYFITVLYAVAMLMYMGLIIYAPALALSRSSGLNIQVAILVTGVICIVYTALGGLKGVLLIDTLMMFIMLAAGLTVVAYGTHQVGDIGEVWEIAKNGSRFEFVPWSADPTIRHTFWSCTIGGIVIIWLLVTNQAITQKFLGLPNLGQVQIAGVAYVLGVEMFCIIYGLSGIVIYAYYVKIGCEPTQTGQIEAADQLSPYFVLDAFRNAGGFPGLFTAAVYGASLSTVSAGMNALAAMTLRDIVNPLHKRKHGSRLTDPIRICIIFKGLTVFWGLVALGIAFLAPLMGRSVLQIGITLLSISSGPLVGVLITGLYVPFTEKIGVFISVVAALVFELVLLVGSTINPVDPIMKPLPSTDNCPVENVTDIITSSIASTLSTEATISTTPKPPPTEGGGSFFEISYLLYAPFGLLITVILGMFCSAIVRCVKGQCYVECPEVENKLLCVWCVPKGQRSSTKEDDDVKIETEKPPKDDMYKNGGVDPKKDDVTVPTVSHDDVTPAMIQTNDLAVASSLAFAYDNQAYTAETARL